MFRGRTVLKLDPKGRLSFPTQFRASLSGTKKLVITNGLYRGQTCLDAYAWSDWLKLEKKVTALPDLDPHVQSFQRFYLASGEPCEMDGQGRLLVPQLLREYADLGEEIVLVGMGTKLEIWQAQKWQKIFGELKNNFESIQAALALLQKEKK